MDRIELEIQKSLEAIPQKAKTGGWKGNAQWTSAVKQGLVDVGQANGYRAAASVCNAYYGSEWLYDLVWYQYDDKTENTTDVPFVMECEWGNKRDIIADFERLLVSRAKYRIMIFQSGTDNDIKKIIHNMKIGIHKFFSTSIGDRYFWAGWATDHWVFANYVVDSK